VDDGGRAELGVDRRPGGRVTARRSTGEAVAQLHAAWLRQLRREWHEINRERLDGRLRPPVLRLTSGRSRLGQWERRSRTLSISADHIWNDRWDTVLQTLAHEVAHQVVDELDGGADDAPHGPAFRDACARIGIEPSASGGPDAEADRVLARVRKLLALAGSTNAHEAEAAMTKANTLLLKYNLQLQPAEAQQGYGHRRVGRSAAALPLHWKLVAVILEEFFFVECIWVSTYNARLDRMERVLEIDGTLANLDFAAHVHDFLHAACERLWRAERKDQPPARSPGSTRSRKREFVNGVLSGFRDKLREGRSTDEERGLIWVGDPRLQAFFAHRHPRVRRLYGAGVHLTGAYRAGERAGRGLTVHRPVRESPTGGSKLLR